MSSDDLLEQQLRRGGAAYVVQVLALLAIPACFVAVMVSGSVWLVIAMGPSAIVAGVATLIAGRSVLPAWSWDIFLSWIVEEPLARQRVMAGVMGVSLILGGSLWGIATAGGLLALW